MVLLFVEFAHLLVTYWIAKHFFKRKPKKRSSKEDGPKKSEPKQADDKKEEPAEPPQFFF